MAGSLIGEHLELPKVLECGAIYNRAIKKIELYRLENYMNMLNTGLREWLHELRQTVAVCLRDGLRLFFEILSCLEE
jgi:hypothetical protein